MKKIKWIIAKIFPGKMGRYFRVIYSDGKRTYLIRESEANDLKACFGGKKIIDYDSICFPEWTRKKSTN